MIKNCFASRKIRIIIVALLTIGVGIVVNKAGVNTENVYQGVSPESFYNIVVPASDNEGIYTDIYGYTEDGVITLFLPTRADATNLTYYAIDSDGKYLEKYQNNFAFNPGKVLEYTIVTMQSGLPSVEIATKEGYPSMSDVNADDSHQTKAYGDMVVSVRDDVAAKNGWNIVYDSRNYAKDKESPESMSIAGRGNLSWNEDKKPYEVKIEDSRSLLGMAKGKKWEFLANVVDHSLLRNEVLLNLAKDCGVYYVSDIQPVDLFVNGIYYGNYSMCSKVEISPSRVNIDENNDYFYRWGLPKGEYKTIDSKTMLYDDNVVQIMNPSSEERNEAAFDIFQNMISAIEDETTDEYLKYVDLESWARYYWVQEIAKNTDASNRSVYSYWNHKTQKMYLISSWDFDRTIGTVGAWNKDLDYDYPTGYTVREDEWYKALFLHPEFVEEVNRIYQQDITTALTKSVNEIPERIERIRLSAMMNFTVWDYLEQPLDGYYNMIEHYMGDSSYESEITWLYEWMKQRRDWLDEENM